MPTQAAGTVPVSVGATVLSKNSCKFQNPPSAALAFGNVDPSSAANATASATLTINCKGASPIVTFSVAHDSGLYETAPNANRMKHATLNEYVPYGLAVTPSSGTIPKGTDQAITIDGTITPANFQNAMVGSYADTVVLTVSP